MDTPRVSRHGWGMKKFLYISGALLIFGGVVSAFFALAVYGWSRGSAVASPAFTFAIMCVIGAIVAFAVGRLIELFLEPPSLP